MPRHALHHKTHATSYLPHILTIGSHLRSSSIPSIPLAFTVGLTAIPFRGQSTIILSSLPPPPKKKKVLQSQTGREKIKAHPDEQITTPWLYYRRHTTKNIVSQRQGMPYCVAKIMWYSSDKAYALMGSSLNMWRSSDKGCLLGWFIMPYNIPAIRHAYWVAHCAVFQ